MSNDQGIINNNSNSNNNIVPPPPPTTTTPTMMAARPNLNHYPYLPQDLNTLMLQQQQQQQQQQNSLNNFAASRQLFTPSSSTGTTTAAQQHQQHRQLLQQQAQLQLLQQYQLQQLNLQRQLLAVQQQRAQAPSSMPLSNPHQQPFPPSHLQQQQQQFYFNASPTSTASANMMNNNNRDFATQQHQLRLLSSYQEQLARQQQLQQLTQQQQLHHRPLQPPNPTGVAQESAMAALQGGDGGGMNRQPPTRSSIASSLHSGHGQPGMLQAGTSPSMVQQQNHYPTSDHNEKLKLEQLLANFISTARSNTPPAAPTTTALSDSNHNNHASSDLTTAMGMKSRFLDESGNFLFHNNHHDNDKEASNNGETLMKETTKTVGSSELLLMKEDLLGLISPASPSPSPSNDQSNNEDNKKISDESESIIMNVVIDSSSSHNKALHSSASAASVTARPTDLASSVQNLFAAAAQYGGMIGTDWKTSSPGSQQRAVGVGGVTPSKHSSPSSRPSSRQQQRHSQSPREGRSLQQWQPTPGDDDPTLNVCIEDEYNQSVSANGKRHYGRGRRDGSESRGHKRGSSSKRDREEDDDPTHIGSRSDKRRLPKGWKESSEKAWLNNHPSPTKSRRRNKWATTKDSYPSSPNDYPKLNNERSSRREKSFSSDDDSYRVSRRSGAKGCEQRTFDRRDSSPDSAFRDRRSGDRSRFDDRAERRHGRGSRRGHGDDRYHDDDERPSRRGRSNDNKNRSISPLRTETPMRDEDTMSSKFGKGNKVNQMDSKGGRDVGGFNSVKNEQMKFRDGRKQRDYYEGEGAKEKGKQGMIGGASSSSSSKFGKPLIEWNTSNKKVDSNNDGGDGRHQQMNPWDDDRHESGKNDWNGGGDGHDKKFKNDSNALFEGKNNEIKPEWNTPSTTSSNRPPIDSYHQQQQQPHAKDGHYDNSGHVNGNNWNTNNSNRQVDRWGGSNRNQQHPDSGATPLTTTSSTRGRRGGGAFGRMMGHPSSGVHSTNNYYQNHQSHQQSKTYRLVICIPINLSYGKLKVTKTNGENFYVFDDDEANDDSNHHHQSNSNESNLSSSAKLLFSANDGVCDAWASFLQIKVGKIENVQSRQIPTIVTIFHSIMRSSLPPQNHDDEKNDTQASSSPTTSFQFSTPLKLNCRGLRVAVDEHLAGDALIPQRSGSIGGAWQTKPQQQKSSTHQETTKLETVGYLDGDESTQQFKSLCIQLKRFAKALGDSTVELPAHEQLSEEEFKQLMNEHEQIMTSSLNVDGEGVQEGVEEEGEIVLVNSSSASPTNNNHQHHHSRIMPLSSLSCNITLSRFIHDEKLAISDGLPILVNEYGDVQNKELENSLMNDKQFADQHSVKDVEISEIRIVHESKKMVDPRFPHHLVLTRQMAGDEDPQRWNDPASKQVRNNQAQIMTGSRSTSMEGDGAPSSPLRSKHETEDAELLEKQQSLENSEGNNDLIVGEQPLNASTLRIGRYVFCPTATIPKVEVSYKDAKNCLSSRHGFIYKRHIQQLRTNNH